MIVNQAKTHTQKRKTNVKLLAQSIGKKKKKQKLLTFVI